MGNNCRIRTFEKTNRRTGQTVQKGVIQEDVVKVKNTKTITNDAYITDIQYGQRGQKINEESYEYHETILEKTDRLYKRERVTKFEDAQELKFVEEKTWIDDDNYEHFLVEYKLSYQFFIGDEIETRDYHIPPIEEPLFEAEKKKLFLENSINLEHIESPDVETKLQTLEIEEHEEKSEIFKQVADAFFASDKKQKQEPKPQIVQEPVKATEATPKETKPVSTTPQSKDIDKPVVNLPTSFDEPIAEPTQIPKPQKTKSRLERIKESERSKENSKSAGINSRANKDAFKYAGRKDERYSKEATQEELREGKLAFHYIPIEGQIMHGNTHLTLSNLIGVKRPLKGANAHNVTGMSWDVDRTFLPFTHASILPAGTQISYVLNLPLLRTAKDNRLEFWEYEFKIVNDTKVQDPKQKTEWIKFDTKNQNVNPAKVSDILYDLFEKDDNFLNILKEKGIDIEDKEKALEIIWAEVDRGIAIQESDGDIIGFNTSSWLMQNEEFIKFVPIGILNDLGDGKRLVRGTYRNVGEQEIDYTNTKILEQGLPHYYWFNERTVKLPIKDKNNPDASGWKGRDNLIKENRRRNLLARKYILASGSLKTTVIDNRHTYSNQLYVDGIKNFNSAYDSLGKENAHNHVAVVKVNVSNTVTDYKAKTGNFFFKGVEVFQERIINLDYLKSKPGGVYSFLLIYIGKDTDGLPLFEGVAPVTNHSSIANTSLKQMYILNGFLQNLAKHKKANSPFGLLFWKTFNVSLAKLLDRYKSPIVYPRIAGGSYSQSLDNTISFTTDNKTFDLGAWTLDEVKSIMETIDQTIKLPQSVDSVLSAFEYLMGNEENNFENPKYSDTQFIKLLDSLKKDTGLNILLKNLHLPYKYEAVSVELLDEKTGELTVDNYHTTTTQVSIDTAVPDVLLSEHPQVQTETFDDFVEVEGSRMQHGDIIFYKEQRWEGDVLVTRDISLNPQYDDNNKLIGHVKRGDEIRTTKDINNTTKTVRGVVPQINSQGFINIFAGRNENVHLSNFAMREFEYEGRVYKSIEHAYQALRNKGEFNEAAYNASTPAQAKKLGIKKIENKGYQVELLKKLVYASFSQNAQAKASLLATGSTKFTHKPSHVDTEKSFVDALNNARERLRNEQENSKAIKEETKTPIEPVYIPLGDNQEIAQAIAEQAIIQSQVGLNTQVVPTGPSVKTSEVAVNYVTNIPHSFYNRFDDNGSYIMLPKFSNIINLGIAETVLEKVYKVLFKHNIGKSFKRSELKTLIKEKYDEFIWELEVILKATEAKEHHSYNDALNIVKLNDELNYLKCNRIFLVGQTSIIGYIEQYSNDILAMEVDTEEVDDGVDIEKGWDDHNDFDVSTGVSMRSKMALFGVVANKDVTTGFAGKKPLKDVHMLLDAIYQIVVELDNDITLERIKAVVDMKVAINDKSNGFMIELYEKLEAIHNETPNLWFEIFQNLNLAPSPQDNILVKKNTNSTDNRKWHTNKRDANQRTPSWEAYQDTLERLQLSPLIEMIGPEEYTLAPHVVKEVDALFEKVIVNAGEANIEQFNKSINEQEKKTPGYKDSLRKDLERLFTLFGMEFEEAFYDYVFGKEVPEGFILPEIFDNMFSTNTNSYGYGYLRKLKARFEAVKKKLENKQRLFFDNKLTSGVNENNTDNIITTGFHDTRTLIEFNNELRFIKTNQIRFGSKIIAFKRKPSMMITRRRKIKRKLKAWDAEKRRLKAIIKSSYHEDEGKQALSLLMALDKIEGSENIPYIEERKKVVEEIKVLESRFFREQALRMDVPNEVLLDLLYTPHVEYHNIISLMNRIDGGKWFNSKDKQKYWSQEAFKMQYTPTADKGRMVDLGERERATAIWAMFLNAKLAADSFGMNMWIGMAKFYDQKASTLIGSGIKERKTLDLWAYEGNMPVPALSDSTQAPLQETFIWFSQTLMNNPNPSLNTLQKNPLIMMLRDELLNSDLMRIADFVLTHYKMENGEVVKKTSSNIKGYDKGAEFIQSLASLNSIVIEIDGVKRTFLEVFKSGLWSLEHETSIEDLQIERKEALANMVELLERAYPEFKESTFKQAIQDYIDNGVAIDYDSVLSVIAVNDEEKRKHVQKIITDRINVIEEDYNKFVEARQMDVREKAILSYVEAFKTLYNKEIVEQIWADVKYFASKYYKVEKDANGKNVYSGTLVQFDIVDQNGQFVIAPFKNKNGLLETARSTQAIVMGFVINSLISNHSWQLMYGADPAQYFKSKRLTDETFYELPHPTFNDVRNDIAIIEKELQDHPLIEKISDFLRGNEFVDLESLYNKIEEWSKGNTLVARNLNFEILLPVAKAITQRMFKDIENNLSKRLKATISPGTLFANSVELPNYLQLHIQDIESVSIVYNDLVQIYYPQEHSEYTEKLNEFKELILNEERNEKEQNRFEELKREFKKAFPKIKDYLEIPTTDAQEYMTWQEAIDIMLWSGDLIQEDYQRIKTKLEAQSQDTKDGVSMVKPENLLSKEDLAIFQPTKPLYSGMRHENINGHMVSRQVYVKTSAYALLPEATQWFKEQDQLRRNIEKLQKETGKNVRATYESGVKTGGVDKMISTDRLFNEDLEIEDMLASSTEMDRENFYIQGSKPFHGDEDSERGKHDEVRRGTQLEKLLLGNGVTKKKHVFDEKFFDDAIIELSEVVLEDGKLDGQGLSEIYNYLYGVEQDLLKDNLFVRLGITSEKDYMEGSVDAMESLVKLLSSRRNLDFEAEALKLVYLVNIDGQWKGFTKQECMKQNLEPEKAKFQHPPLFLSRAKKFESMINSVIREELMRLKLPGISVVLGSQAGYKKIRAIEGGDSGTNKFDYQNLLEQGAVFTTSYDPEVGLQPSRVDENGVFHPAQVLIPNNFKVLNNEGRYEIINFSEYINEDGFIEFSENLPQELFQLFSFRTPASSHQSGTSIEVVGFLPHHLGTLMIVPQDHLIQIGEDYDIDTRSVYKYFLHKRGKRLMKSFLTKEDLLNRVNINEKVKAYNDLVKAFKSDLNFWDDVNNDLKYRKDSVLSYIESVLRLEELEKLAQELDKQEKDFQEEKKQVHHEIKASVIKQLEEKKQAIPEFLNNEEFLDELFEFKRERNKKINIEKLKTENDILAIEFETRTKRKKKLEEKLKKETDNNRKRRYRTELYKTINRLNTIKKRQSEIKTARTIYYLKIDVAKLKDLNKREKKLNEMRQKVNGIENRRVVVEDQKKRLTDYNDVDENVKGLSKILAYAKSEAGRKKIANIKSMRKEKEEAQKKHDVLLQAIQNNIIGLYLAFYTSSSPEIQELIRRSLSLEFIDNSATDIHNERYSVLDDGYSFFAPHVQEQIFKAGSDGQAGVGFHSNAITGTSVFEQLDEPFRIYKSTSIGEVFYNYPLGNKTYDAVFGRKVAVGKRKDGQEIIKDVASVLVESQNAATDNQKLGAMAKINENTHTIKVFSVLQMAGFEIDGELVNGKEYSWTALFIAQPIMWEFVRELQKVNSGLSETYTSEKELLAFQNLLEKYPELQLKDISTDFENNLEILRRSGMRLTSNFLFSQLRKGENFQDDLKTIGKDGKRMDIEAQLYILSMFMLLSNHYKTLSSLQRLFNTENKGIGADFLSVLNSRSFMLGLNELPILPVSYDRVPTSRGDTYLYEYFFGKTMKKPEEFDEKKIEESARESIRRKYENNPDVDTQEKIEEELYDMFIEALEEEKRRHKEFNEFVESGAILVDKEKGIYIKPRYAFAQKPLRNLNLAYDILNPLFPYDNEVFRRVFDYIQTHARANSLSATERVRKLVTDSLIDYSILINPKLFGNSVGRVRNELFVDRDATTGQMPLPANESLATYIMRLKETNSLNGITFFGKNIRGLDVLQITPLRKGFPRYITFYKKLDYSPSELRAIRDELRDLVDNESPLPLTWNGKTMTYATLMRELLRYSLLANQKGGAAGFRQNLPMNLFMKYMVTDNLEKLIDPNKIDYASQMYNGYIDFLERFVDGKFKAAEDGNILVGEKKKSVEEIKAFVEYVKERYKEATGKELTTLEVLDDGSIIDRGSVALNAPNFFRQFFQHNVGEVAFAGNYINTKTKTYVTKINTTSPSSRQIALEKNGELKIEVQGYPPIGDYLKIVKDGVTLLFEFDRIENEDYDPDHIYTSSGDYYYKQIPVLGNTLLNEYDPMNANITPLEQESLNAPAISKEIFELYKASKISTFYNHFFKEVPSYITERLMNLGQFLGNFKVDITTEELEHGAKYEDSKLIFSKSFLLNNHSNINNINQMVIRAVMKHFTVNYIDKYTIQKKVDGRIVYEVKKDVPKDIRIALIKLIKIYNETYEHIKKEKPNLLNGYPVDIHLFIMEILSPNNLSVYLKEKTYKNSKESFLTKIKGYIKDLLILFSSFIDYRNSTYASESFQSFFEAIDTVYSVENSLTQVTVEDTVNEQLDSKAMTQATTIVEPAQQNGGSVKIEQLISTYKPMGANGFVKHFGIKGIPEHINDKLKPLASLIKDLKVDVDENQKEPMTYSDGKIIFSKEILIKYYNNPKGIANLIINGVFKYLTVEFIENEQYVNKTVSSKTGWIEYQVKGVTPDNLKKPLQNFFRVYNQARTKLIEEKERLVNLLSDKNITSNNKTEANHRIEMIDGIVYKQGTSAFMTLMLRDGNFISKLMQENHFLNQGKKIADMNFWNNIIKKVKLALNDILKAFLNLVPTTASKGGLHPSSFVVHAVGHFFEAVEQANNLPENSSPTDNTGGQGATVKQTKATKSVKAEPKTQKKEFTDIVKDLASRLSTQLTNRKVNFKEMDKPYIEDPNLTNDSELNCPI